MRSRRPSAGSRPSGCRAAGSRGTGAFPPCVELERSHRQILRLCHALEEIADDLPSSDRLRCLALALSLVQLLRECHRCEEEVVFPAFARERRGAARIVARLTGEHLADGCAAEDLSEVLLAHGQGRPIENPEALGYMLRALFEAMRRHVAFEQDHVLPAITGTIL